MEKLHRQFVEGCAAPAGHDRGDRRGAVPPGRRVRELRVRQVARGGVRPDRLRIGVPQAVLPGPVPGRAHQRPADGLLPGRGPRQRREAPRRGGPAGRHQRLVVQDDDRVGGPARASRCRRGGIDAAAGAGPLAGLRRPVGRGAATAGRPKCRPAGASASGSHLVKGIGEQHEALLDAELARGPYRVAGRRRRADRPARGGPRAAHPDRGARFAGPAAARAAVAAARGGRRVTRPGGRPDAARARAGGRQARRGGGRPMDLRLPATDAPALPGDHRVGADRRRLRGHRAGCPAAGRRAVPAGAGPAGRGHQRGARRATRRAGSGSAGWS